MAHQCGCGHGSGPKVDTVQAETPIRADETVGDVARRPRTLDVLKDLGINHCCGAHLTLREAAAAAGTPLETLLAALNEGARLPHRALDVRGLEPPQPMLRVLEEIEKLPPGTRLEVRHDRRPLLLYPQLEHRGFRHETDEPEPGLVRIRIWKDD